MDPLSGVFAAFGLAASAGLNAYIPMLTLAILARFTNLITLTPPWDALTSWWVIATLIVLSAVEFFADKVPAVNHANDVIQTFVRPVAGAIAFAASANVITDVSPILSMIAGLFIATGVHAAKSVVVRPVVTATTGGVGNVPVSMAEDITATIISVMAIVVPVLFACILIVVTAYIVWLLWRRANAQKRSEV